MRKLRMFTRRRKGAIRRTLEKVEAAILVRQGRKAVRARARTVASVAAKGARTGLVVGTVAAALRVRNEIKTRRGLG
jgi:hypothetical protein